MNETLFIEDLQFIVRRSPRRATIGITVDRDGRLLLAAPDICPRAHLERVAHKKLVWVRSKLAEREPHSSAAWPKQFASGEGFYFLGQSYRLRLVEPTTQNAALDWHHDWFWLRSDESQRGQQHFQRWYIRQGRRWFDEHVDRWACRVGVVPKGYAIRDLGFRWGSCGAMSKLNFHWRTIQLPPAMIEYVLAHELVHLHEPSHNAAYWERLERALPDCQERRLWLAQHGSRF